MFWKISTFTELQPKSKRKSPFNSFSTASSLPESCSGTIISLSVPNSLNCTSKNKCLLL